MKFIQKSNFSIIQFFLIIFIIFILYFYKLKNADKFIKIDNIFKLPYPYFFNEHNHAGFTFSSES